MKQLVNIVNQVFEIEKKIGTASAILRHIERIKAELTEMGYSYHSPLHEGWDETRTDCEASVSGVLKSKMVISEVVKPVVYFAEGGDKKIIQKAIVIVG